MKRTPAQQAANKHLREYRFELHAYRQKARRKESEHFITAPIDPDTEEHESDEPGSLFDSR